MSTRPVHDVSEQDLPTAEIRDRYRAKEHSRSAHALPKKAITMAHKHEKAKKDPEDLTGGRQHMREAILQLSLFPNIYNKKILMTSM